MISLETPPNSTPAGEGVPSFGETCRRWTPTRVPAPISLASSSRVAAESGAAMAFIRAVEGGKGLNGSENGRYANHETALIFPIVLRHHGHHELATN